jgi:hypothetical protein
MFACLPRLTAAPWTFEDAVIWRHLLLRPVLVWRYVYADRVDADKMLSLAVDRLVFREFLWPGALHQLWAGA